jgi:hypothetical protein
LQKSDYKPSHVYKSHSATLSDIFDSNKSLSGADIADVVSTGLMGVAAGASFIPG